MRAPSLSKDERELILVYCDGDRAWTLFCDSRTYGGRVRKWLAALGIAARSSEPGTIVADGIPAWAVGFRARRGRGRGNPARLKTPPSMGAKSSQKRS
jgi:hypothetical protein